ncbi:hypothetical protein TSAR_010223 [Trichomalopsis sarcophagae]|uniref:Uncharacterized protein n=1 Tax=Trichomalopsis sarcophagae TaxID=543379 RepID=A0A232FMR7_9HYME|nr:hypothetical protein TSAR_010223 [Trichomalopsis sarcophagae]
MSKCQNDSLDGPSAKKSITMFRCQVDTLIDRTSSSRKSIEKVNRIRAHEIMSNYEVEGIELALTLIKKHSDESALENEKG